MLYCFYSKGNLNVAISVTLNFYLVGASLFAIDEIYINASSRKGLALTLYSSSHKRQFGGDPVEAAQ